MLGLKGIPALYGGVERHVEELARRLAGRGHEVTVYCRRHYTPAHAEVAGVRLRRLRSVNTKHLDAWTHTLLATADVLGRRFDILHYHALGPATFILLPRALGKRVVVTVHGLDWRREKWGPLAAAYLRAGELVAARAAHEVIVVSRELERHFAARWGRQVTYIPNAVTPSFTPNPDVLRKYGLERGKYILTVGRLVPEKGLHLLIEVYGGFATDMPLVVVGDDPTGKYLAQLKRTADDRVKFLGYIYGPPLAALFAGCYLYVHPSTLEGLSIALLEAMSYGAGVLASDIAPNREALADAGFYFRAGDVASLREVLGGLLSRPDAVRAKGQAAKERAGALYSWEEVARRTEAVYEKALRK